MENPPEERLNPEPRKKTVYYFYVPNLNHNPLCFLAHEEDFDARNKGDCIEGIFVSRNPLPKGKRTVLLNKMKEFEINYNGIFIPFEFVDFE